MPLFATYVKYARTDRGLTLRRVAEVIGVDPSYMSRLERGEIAAPSEEILTKLSTALGRPEVEVYLAAGRVTPGLTARLEREMPNALLQISRTLELLETDPSEYAGLTEEDDDTSIHWMTPQDEEISELIHEGMRQIAQIGDLATRGVITKQQLENALESLRHLRLALTNLDTQP